MSDTDKNVLSQADRLMQRHRTFTASAQAKIETPAADNLPVLTDVVPHHTASTPPAVAFSSRAIEERVQVLAHELMLARLSAQREMVEKEMLTWLDTELPHIVTRVVDSITDQLVAQIIAAVHLNLMPKLQLAIEAENQPTQNTVR
jgi:uncharacterized FlaG/YvyC family protein